MVLWARKRNRASTMIQSMNPKMLMHFSTPIQSVGCLWQAAHSGEEGLTQRLLRVGQNRPS